MRNRKILGAAFVALVAVLGGTQAVLDLQASQGDLVQAPVFEVDPLWPKPLPNRWLLGMTIGVWVDEQDREVRRMIAHFDDNFHVGFGLFSVGKGSNFTFDQKLVNNELWLPTDGQAHLIAHAIGIIGYRADIAMTDSGYQKFHAEAQQLPGAKVAQPPAQ